MTREDALNLFNLREGFTSEELEFAYNLLYNNHKDKPENVEFIRNARKILEQKELKGDVYKDFLIEELTKKVQLIMSTLINKEKLKESSHINIDNLASAVRERCIKIINRYDYFDKRKEYDKEINDILGHFSKTIKEVNNKNNIDKYKEKLISNLTNLQSQNKDNGDAVAAIDYAIQKIQISNLKSNIDTIYNMIVNYVTIRPKDTKELIDSIIMKYETSKKVQSSNNSKEWTTVLLDAIKLANAGPFESTVGLTNLQFQDLEFDKKLLDKVSFTQLYGFLGVEDISKIFELKEEELPKQKDNVIDITGHIMAKENEHKNDMDLMVNLVQRLYLERQGLLPKKDNVINIDNYAKR